MKNLSATRLALITWFFIFSLSSMMACIWGSFLIFRTIVVITVIMSVLLVCLGWIEDNFD